MDYIKETQEDARVLRMNDGEGGPPVNVFVDQAPSSISRRGTPKPQGISLIIFVLTLLTVLDPIGINGRSQADI